MTQLDKLMAWLQTFPLWQELEMETDHLSQLPNSAGLYPRGIRELGRKKDITGAVRGVNALELTLYRRCCSGQQRTDNARWLLALQLWIQEQSALGLCPALGDEPQAEKIRAEQGRLESADQTGTDRYAVIVTAEFIKYY